MKYFESDSVKGLYQVMQEWEETNGRVSDEGTRFFEQIDSVHISYSCSEYFFCHNLIDF